MEIRTVLLVDDDPSIRMVGEVALTTIGGWEVTTASSGDEALAVAVENPPDVVLLDVMMPGRGGLQTLADLRSDARTAHIPVVLITAKVLPGEVGTYVEAGAHGVIAKPFDPVGLPDEIRRAVNGTGGGGGR